MAIVCTKLLRSSSSLASLRVKRSFLLDVRPPSFSARLYASVLFLPGNKANETCAILSPQLDFDERFSDVDKLKNELNLRGINMDVDGMKKKWDFYKELDSNRSNLEQRRSEIAHQIKSLSKKSSDTKDDELEITRLKTLGKTLREDLKVLKETIWELEESVVNQALKLPNILHSDTPQDKSVVLHPSKAVLKTLDDGISSKNHIEIAEGLGLLKYSTPMNYYLCGEAALFELAALKLSANIFSDNKMLRVTGLDFSRSLIVEAAGMDHENPEESFTLKDNEEIEKHSSNRMHLVGGASLPSFLAMHTKQLINPNQFPLRYFACGRQYAPFSKNLEEAGLFTVCQASAVQVFFLLDKNFQDEEHREEFDRLLNSVKYIYDSICTDYQIVIKPARDLRAWESLRVSIELWSPNLNKFVEVGHLSLCGQYFSKRLLIGYQTPKGRIFPSVITGTVLSVPKLLGCLLEQYPNELLISDRIKELFPV